MKIYNPASGEVIAEKSETSTEQIHSLFMAARIAQKEWGKRSVAERVQIIKKFSEKLDCNKKELAAITASETGKPLAEAEGEINGANYRISYFLENSEKVLKAEHVNTDGNTQEHLGYDPLGVIANISAWNYPYLVGVNVFIPALIAGNAVLYKPSEFASLTGLKFAELLKDSGLPENIFVPIIGGKVQGQALLDLNLDGYFFTGSYRTGKYIAESVAPKLVPLGLELGGKDPLYITDDLLSIESAAASAVEGAFYNNGQSCCAVERIYVHEKVYEQFVNCFVAEVGKLAKVPLTREAQISILEDQTKDAIAKGAGLRSGGQRHKEAGYFFEPTVLTEVNHDMIVMRDESFGPIIGLQKVSSDAEAITLMNDTEFGLTAGVFCQDQQRSRTLLEQLDAGNVYQNCCDRVSPYLPWAGRHNSGLGATLSTQGILTFVQSKGFHLRTL